MRPRSSERANTSPLAVPLGLDLPGTVGTESSTQDLGDPAVGEWLFKKNDVVLGPVNASVILSRIQADELDGETPIGREAGKWRPLKEIEYFADEVERATRRREMDEQRRFAESKRRKEQGLRSALYAAAIALPLGAGFSVGESLAETRPWDDREAWVARLPSLIELPPPPKPAPPAVVPPGRNATPTPSESKVASVTQVSRTKDAEPPEETGEEKSAAKKTKRKSRNKSGKKRVAKGKSDKSDASREDENAPSALPETLTNQQVMAGLAKGKSAIGACLQQENARNPDMPGVVTLMFTVTEAGQATLIQVKERQVRDGPLAKCLEGVVSKLRWPKFSGERKNAEVPFRIRK